MQHQQDQRCYGEEPFDRYTDVDDRHFCVTGTEQKLLVDGRDGGEYVERDDEVEGVDCAEMARAVVRRFSQAI